MNGQNNKQIKCKSYWICGNKLFALQHYLTSLKLPKVAFLCPQVLILPWSHISLLLNENCKFWICWTEIQHAAHTGHWKAAYHMWSRNPLSSQLHGLVKLPCLCVCICPKRCIGLILTWSLSSTRESSQKELSFFAPATCPWKRWHYSEAIPSHRSPVVANKAGLLSYFPAFLCLFQPFNPRRVPPA